MRRALTIAVLLLGLATPAAAQNLEGTLKKVKDTSTLTLGYRENSPPFSFMSPIVEGGPRRLLDRSSASESPPP